MSAPTEGLEALLPCPFCGGKPYVCQAAFEGDGYQIGCDCGAGNSEQAEEPGAIWRDGATLAEATARWNRRTALQASPAGRETDADVWAWGVRFPDRDDEVRLTEQHAHDATLDYEEGECEIIPLGALRGRETGTRIEECPKMMSGCHDWSPRPGPDESRVQCLACGLSGHVVASPEPASPPDGEVGGAS